MFAHALTERLRHQAQHLVADAVSITVIEFLEVIDVDQECAERSALLHDLCLRGAEEFLQRAAVRQSSQAISPRPLFRLRQRLPDHVELARLFDKLRFEPARARRRLGELVHQGFDQQPRIGPGIGAVGNVADCFDLGAVVGNRRREEFLREGQHVVQLLRDLVGDRLVDALGANISRVEVVVGCRVELALVGDKNIDGALQRDRRAQCVSEPDVEIMRCRRNALPGEGGHGLFGHAVHIFEVQFVEGVGQGDALATCGYIFSCCLGGEALTNWLSAPQPARSASSSRHHHTAARRGCVGRPQPLTPHGLLWPSPPSSGWHPNPRKSSVVS